MQDLLAQSVEIEERRPRMMKAPSGIVAQQFVEMFGSLHLKSVGREIGVLKDGNGEQVAIHDQKDQQKSAGRDRDREQGRLRWGLRRAALCAQFSGLQEEPPLIVRVPRDESEQTWQSSRDAKAC